MDSKNYKLVFTGEFIPGISMDVIYEKLIDVLGMDLKEIKEKFSDKKTTIREKATKQECIKLRDALLFAGAQCEIEKLPSDGSDADFKIEGL